MIIDKLNKLASVLLAKSIKDLYPNTLLGQVKVNENGFQYSFAFDNGLSIKDFPKILKQMKKNIDRSYDISYANISIEEANKIFVSEKYKQKLIDGMKEIPIIKIGNDFVDICENLGINKLKINSFLLLNVAGSYWMGSVQNEQLTEISGIAFDSKKEMEEFQANLLNQKEGDHRKIGSELELFTFDQLAGQGLPIWLPKGAAIKYEIDLYIHQLLQRNNYMFVNSPILGSKSLYETSGHWQHYKDTMFPPLDVDGDIQILRPMTCPHHLLVYLQKPRSYRELPFKIAEHAILHRYESSGSLTGLERVRTMQLIDTHIICTIEQISKVVDSCYRIINEASNTFGVKIHSIDLALHDRKNKFFDNEKMWQESEDALRRVLHELKIDFKEQIGEAAFYGPKIDLQVKTATNRVITAYTIQLDFLLPEKFNLQYKDEKGILKRPVLVHASVIGTLERFMSILLEQNKGVFPLWLAPTQVAVIPVDPIHHGIFCEKITSLLQDELIRVEFDNSNERLSKKIRDAQVQKIPYQVILGEAEIKGNFISYRKYGQENTSNLPINDFINLLKKEVTQKK